MICGECDKGEIRTVVGNGITEPPYVTVVKCPHDDEYYKDYWYQCDMADLETK